MKWVTHQAAAVTAGLALHLPLAGLGAMCAGAVLPDILDQRLAGLAWIAQMWKNNIFKKYYRGT